MSPALHGKIFILMDKKPFLPQIFLTLCQALITLIVAGGATWILAAFKESVPQSLRDIFLYVIWWAVIAMLVWLVLRVILGEAPKRLIQWIRKYREHKATQRRLKYWRVKFSELADLIIDAAGTDWHVTDKQEGSYHDLHLWFELNWSKILPLWRYFQSSRTEPANVFTSLSTTDSEYAALRDHHDDPFSIFYEPMTFSLLKDNLESWNKKDIIHVLQELHKLNLEFTIWSSARYYLI